MAPNAHGGKPVRGAMGDTRLRQAARPARFTCGDILAPHPSRTVTGARAPGRYLSARARQAM